MSALDAGLADRLRERAEAHEALGQDVVSLAERELELGRRLLTQALTLNIAADALERGEPTPAAETPAGDRSVGRFGSVDIDGAVRAAKALTQQHGDFGRTQFQEETGLGASAASKWLSRLIHNGSVGSQGAGRFAYVEPPAPANGRRPRSARAVDRSAGVGADAPSRGAPMAHVRKIGGSGKPGLDKKRAAQGRTVKRRRQGT